MRKHDTTSAALEFVPRKLSKYALDCAKLEAHYRKAMSGNLAMTAGVPHGVMMTQPFGSPTLGQEKLLTENAQKVLGVRT